ncbi:hypothetical protein [Deinococcus altitudinis]|uniref:hypothetical protein n=1 Tax=Deinococcus altitudinis TaxID=468914 RepID=UPI003891F666
MSRLPFRRPPYLSRLVTFVCLAASFAGGASAQLVNISLAAGLNGLGAPTLSAGFTFRNVLLLRDYGLNARLIADVGGGSALDFSGLLDIPLYGVSENLNLYAGPGVALSFGRPVRLRPSLTAGLNYDVDGQTSVFGEGSYQLQGQFRVRAGILYSF